MGKADLILALGILGAIGIGAYMLFTGKIKLPEFKLPSLFPELKIYTHPFFEEEGYERFTEEWFEARRRRRVAEKEVLITTVEEQKAKLAEYGKPVYPVGVTDVRTWTQRGYVPVYKPTTEQLKTMMEVQVQQTPEEARLVESLRREQRLPAMKKRLI